MLCQGMINYISNVIVSCLIKDNDAAAIVSNDSDMILFAVCPVMHARGLVTARRRVVLMYPSYFCEDIGLSVERLPLLSVYLGNQETPITTNVVEATDGVIQRKIKSGDRGNVQVRTHLHVVKVQNQ